MIFREDMKVAFACENNNGIESKIAAHFGRCPYYIIVDIEGGEVKGVRAVENPIAGGHEPGYLPNYLAGMGVKKVVAGGMGPRAVEWFSRLGIETVIEMSCTVKEVLARIVGK